MRIVVVGASGMVGSRVVAEAVRRGHHVTAVSRSGTDAPGASSVAHDLTDTRAMTQLADGADAMVLAVPPDRSGGSAEPVVEAHRRLIAAQPATRLVVVGGAGSLERDGRLLVDSAGFPEAAKPESRAFTDILDDYRASTGLDWTFVSPSPVIAPGERTGHVIGGDSPVGDFVSAEDFADAIVDEVEQPAHRGERFTVASRG